MLYTEIISGQGFWAWCSVKCVVSSMQYVVWPVLCVVGSLYCVVCSL